MISSRPHRIFLIFLAAYVAWGLLYILRTSFLIDGSRVFVLWDDGMVTMRYARNLAAGYGAVWNQSGGEHVEGYSNLGVMLMMTAIHFLPLSPTRTSLVFQLVNLGLLGYCAILVREITRNLFENEAAATVAAIVSMACAPIALLSLQGTDVGVITAVLLVALKMVVAQTREPGKWPAHVYVVLAIGILVRLDFALVYMVFVAASLFFPRTKGSLPVAAGVFALTLGTILGFQAWYYGDPLPNTYYLKGTGSPLGLVIATGLIQQLPFLQRAAVPLTFAAVALYMFQRRDRRVWLLGAVPLALTAYDIGFGGDWLPEYMSRFFVPALPLLIIATVGGLWLIFARLVLPSAGVAGMPPGLGPTREARVAGLIIVSVLLAFVFNTNEALREWFSPVRETMYRKENIGNYRTALYLAEHTSPDATVAVHWAGVLPYFLERNTVDVLGKNDHHIAHMVVTVFYPGHSKWDWRYIVEERRPDFIDLTSRGLAEREDFVSTYSRATGDGVTFYVRNESASKLLDPTATIVRLN